MKRTITLSTFTLVAALALAACGGSTEDGTTDTTTTNTETVTSAPEATTGTTTDQAPGESAAEHNNADVMFTRMMIPHHQQAVEMSQILLAKDNIPSEVVDFAQRVFDTQTAEVDQMNAMLETWEQQPGSDNMGGMSGMGSDSGHMGSDNMGNMGNMGGMMDQEGMTALENAEGTEAVRLYLEDMIPHHEGAIDMARTEVNNGRNSQTIALAEQMITTQEAEITEMEQMLQNL
ncbi:DUF305 domain-containing protein [Corynebacterium halotolerans]|uniref:DUF305 domain-containing protein n=1 Tax=Corynebacterium halotolerans YIM 70093 = DSM 44683 TaxID=1121362 RepID=M1NWG1_9CORY|nr:DUF305 domain-containing protein [Corynebacterium halotolerans]AGF73827.1 hypothetical protein A605_14277 [Corynebacterium halotolerans YIM 70093 = DSM 44683]